MKKNEQKKDTKAKQKSEKAKQTREEREFYRRKENRGPNTRRYDRQGIITAVVKILPISVNYA
jgi:hypothetical protein